MTRAVVVGSGPNGLAAALTLADQGLEVTVLEAADTLGGGTRSRELTLPGLVHDECSGFHPLAVDNAFTRRFDLAAQGLRWRWAEVEYSHPLDDGRGAAAWRSVERTAAALGPDERAWLQVFGSVSRHFDRVAEDFLRPVVHVPTHPVALATFGARAVAPATLLARRFATPEARALFAGAAAHAMRPLTAPLTSAIGLALGASAHRYGWPVAEGGSASISRAVVGLLTQLGGRVETGVEVTSLDQVGDADVVLLDLAPAAAARVIGDRLPARVRRSYERYRHGPGAFKLDLAVEGGVPWRHAESRAAGTVHVGGTLAEVAHTEREVDRGRMPERPFVLVGQQHLADPGRSRDGVHPVYAYAHVPAGWDGDPAVAREALLGQLERFAPGVRERVVAEHVTTPRDWERLDANFVGGDVITGANTVGQLLLRPRPALDPYATGVDGVYLCSAATPPGAGAHGMCGWNAARSALRRL
ncbi:phytoene desaturase family protein [Nocardioides korecus]